MRRSAERAGRGLLDDMPGATALWKVNGAVPAAWPVTLDFGAHRLEIARDGAVRLIEPAPGRGNPAPGRAAGLGRLTVQARAGALVLPEREVAIQLEATGPALALPQVAPRRVSADAPPGTLLARVTVEAGADVVLLRSGGLPVEVRDGALWSTGPLVPGTREIALEARRGADTAALRVALHVDPPLGPRGQHDPDDPAHAGPMGGEAAVHSPRGAALHPEGPGVWRYVDAAAAPGGDGLSPGTAHRTIQAAVEAHGEGDSILVAPGLYAEAVEGPGAWGRPNLATPAHRVKLARRGTGRVEITATDPLGGWTRCVEGDAHGNPNWARMWKATLPAGHPLEPWECVLMQDGRAAYLRVDGPGYAATEDMFTQNAWSRAWTEAHGVRIGPGAGLDAIVLAPVLRGYPQGALDHARAVVQHLRGNNSLNRPIRRHDAERGAIVVDFGRDDPGRYFLLLNVARAIDAPGQWAYAPAPGGGHVVYFLPWDEAAMDRVRISARSSVFDLRQAAHWTLYGLDGTGAGGAEGTRESMVWWSSENAAMDRPGLHLEECRAHAYFSGPAGAGKGFEFARCPGMRIVNCTASDSATGKGISLVGSPGAWVDRCLMARLGNTALNASTAYEQVFSHNEIREMGTAHGNGMSLYQGARRVVVWGNRIDTGEAIGMTHQASAELWICMNLVVAPRGDPYGHRGIENNATAPPEIHRGPVFEGEIVLLSNTVAPWPGATGAERATGIVTGRTTGATHHACANVSFGGIDPTDDGARSQPMVVERGGRRYATRIGRFEGNVVLRDFSTAIASNPFFASGANLHALRAAEVFADPAAGDWRPAPGGPLDAAGGDHSDLLPRGAWIDWFDMSRDADGRPFDWASGAPVGALLPG